jgi:hypothetical protein
VKLKLATRQVKRGQVMGGLKGDGMVNSRATHAVWLENERMWSLDGVGSSSRSRYIFRDW